MRKIRILSGFMVFFLLAFAAPLAAGNGQEIIPLSSGLYDAMDALYIMEGKAMPSGVRPWSAAEAEKYFSLVSAETSPALYNYIAGILGRKSWISFDETVEIDARLISNINLYYHTDTDFDFPFNEVDNYFFRMDNDNDKSILRPELDLYFGDLFSLFFSFNIRNADWTDDIPFDSRNFNFDISPFTPDGFTFDMDLSVPDRAFLSAGGSFWNIQLGRDRFKIGVGETGNMVLSDSFPYHNLLRLDLFGTKLKFSFAVSSFWHTDIYDMEDEDIEGIFLFMTNRLEAHLFSGRLSFAFNNSTIFKDDGGVFNLRYMNPVDFFHNFFVSHKQNSSVAFELVFAVARGWNIYSQVIIDDISSPGENDGEADTAPNQIGYLLGVRYSTSLGRGILDLDLEAAYTYPFLYLRSTNRNDQPPEDHGLGYIGIVRGVGGGLRLRRYFIGYPYGGDAAVIDLSGSYVVPDDIRAEAEVFFMVHGEKNIDSLYRHGELSPALSGELTYYSYGRLYFRKEITGYLGVYGEYVLARGGSETDNQFVLGARIEI